ncbi:hypothetical protein RRG08_003891 [Elysia crispata]|uniref:Uncharacterized protein n=1 Tax=Elysia crispata TaxID=231223 RepID=A0AAE0ZE58_9GAST|nr:hypothetical protein RRG08_003891 [Elysia crispata]
MQPRQSFTKRLERWDEQSVICTIYKRYVDLGYRECRLVPEKDPLERWDEQSVICTIYKRYVDLGYRECCLVPEKDPLERWDEQSVICTIYKRYVDLGKGDNEKKDRVSESIISVPGTIVPPPETPGLLSLSREVETKRRLMPARVLWDEETWPGVMVETPVPECVQSLLGCRIYCLACTV